MTQTDTLAPLLDLAANGEWAAVREQGLPLWRADPHDMRVGLLAGAALLQTGHSQDGVAVLSMLSEQNPIIRTAHYNPAVHPVLQACARLADSAIRAFFTESQTKAIADYGVHKAGRIASALWPQTHNGAVPYPDDKMGPKPYIFFAPDLPATAVFDNDTANWTADVSRHCADITAEFIALMDSDAQAGAPYVPASSRLGADWSPLKGQKNWNAVHLFKDGVPQPAADACPKTVAALRAVPMVHQNGHPMEVFFSVLKPGVTIPAHYGLANCRATGHLPLIVPGDGAIRVGTHTHRWQVGQPFIFDDSFDHSAWNHHTDSMRVVLIFEAWRPDMSDDEIGAVQASYRARNALIADRKARFERVLIGAT